LKQGESRIPVKKSVFVEKGKGYSLSDRGLDHVNAAGYSEKLNCKFALSVHLRVATIHELRALLNKIDSNSIQNALKFLITGEYPWRADYEVKKSLYKAQDDDGNKKEIGKGVIAKKNFLAGEILNSFKGNVINQLQVEMEREGNRSTYIIRMTGTQNYMDCRYAAMAGLCEMSMVNDARNLHHSITNKPAKANSIIKTFKGKLVLMTNVPVGKGEELFLDYGDDYAFQDGEVGLSLCQLNLEGRLDENCIDKKFLNTVNGTGYCGYLSLVQAFIEQKGLNFNEFHIC
jgi:hypothetical protein